MKIFLNFIKWLSITIFSIIILSILYLRFSRFSDKYIYEMNDTDYFEFKSELNYEEYYFDVDNDVKIHGVLFKPDSLSTIGTIFHYSGKGANLMSSIQDSYKPLLKKGFQVFCFERRNFGKSNGEAINSLTLKNDALFIFDQVAQLKHVANKPIIIWGQSLGGTFATMNANERQEKVKGLILEGTFSSFPDIGKVYASVLHLKNFTWIVPLIMNNDFPVENEIEELTIPTIILHSKTDEQIPFELGKKIYKSANKHNTEFWEIDGKHLLGIYYHEKKYIENFIKIIEK